MLVTLAYGTPTPEGKGKLSVEPELFLEPGAAASSFGSLQEEQEGLGLASRGHVRLVGEGARDRGGSCKGRVRVQEGTRRSQVDYPDVLIMDNTRLERERDQWRDWLGLGF